jgi:phenylpropionate dioxygenase-like ring-hydroxylating dioxygenase large terminal subunit
MRQQEQVRVIEGLMKHLDEGTNADVGHQVNNPVSAYIGEDRARQEWDDLFQNYPQIVGLSADLPEVGSFFTSNDLGKPILCTRNKDGEYKAFLNVCAHGGTLLVAEPRGRKTIFSCPFHAWGYSTNGDLVAVPKEEHFGQVDKECHSLTTLLAVEKYGLLWVCFDQSQTIDVGDLLGDLADELATWELDSCTAMGDEIFTHDMNW